MSYRRLIFAENQFYHVFNKSVGNEAIFVNKSDLSRALELIEYYRFKSQMSYSKFKSLGKEMREIKRKQIFSTPPLVNIHSMSLMPNHYHFSLEQKEDKGIPTFIANLQNSFAKYFNTKNDRVGALFMEMFKAKWIGSEELLFHITRYHHLNPVTSYLIKIQDLAKYPYTSFPNFIGHKIHSFIDTSLILSHFKTGKAYAKFVYDQEDYQKKLREIGHLLMREKRKIPGVRS